MLRNLFLKNMINVSPMPKSPVFSPSSSFSCKSSTESLSSSSPPTFTFRPLVPSVGATSCSSSPSVSKRKRPAKLNIPVGTCGFSSMATKEKDEDMWKEIEVDGDGYSVYCKKGKRDVMEDRFKAVVEFNGQQKQAFFGVFDGHGGPKAAEFAAENLNKNIVTEVEKLGENNIVEAIRQGFMNTDSQFQTQDHQGGSCCVTAFIRDSKLVVSNAGDCRAVVSIGGMATPLTSDHRPSRPDEKLRIQSLGGYVDTSRGVPRVLGSLAVSRGIGDRSLKQWITAEPETKVVKILPEFEFLIMASDGLWGKVSNQEAVDLARSFCVGNDKLEPVLACKKLVELSLSRGSVDDTTMMIVQLDRFR